MLPHCPGSSLIFDLSWWVAAFNGPTSSVFQSLSPEPVASASLGQVYKGRLRPELGGDEVAVKVQRPAMLESIALDLYLMRSFALFAQRFPNVSGFLWSPEVC